MPSSDSPCKFDSNDCVQSAIASPNHLNSINIAGIPLHKLTLENNALIMITTNLNFSEGVVKSPKAKFLHISQRVLQLKLLDGSESIVLLPRISFKGRVGKYGVQFTRMQFSVRLAYAITINKRQGQSLTRVGLD